ncbi:aldehyde dehydrogenase family protein [Undibacterium cyanobacteriorum]|uniref:Aldehyde dehydrogenase family protein n=1 Tax=Undibacterium cyanobacteriorum TaxID=3073561 RepID=A0ABY9REU6_9BURK|nr:aldehyde dehydrogenase family protein [Undibacterium sp. 20NA77.5]WMW79354.1 aldehyde dehydrogenase family protein [Undibacterium sp. 20NA77.5]
MSIFKHFINGEWHASSQTRPNHNPSQPNQVVGEYAEASADDVALAVQAARQAATVWGRSTPQQRFDVLDFIGSEILARKQELGHLLASEEGKVLPEAIGEVSRAGFIFKYFAGEALRMGGQALASVRPNMEVLTSREAVGVVGLITPWNFPIAIPAWKAAPALACGNSVILKPSELTPGCAWALAEIISRSGLPKGAFNLVMGDGVAGRAMVEDPHVDAISFTGSVQTGKLIAQHCALHMKKYQLEMGGKNPLVILDDADLNIAVECAVNGAFFSTGQRCTASSRTIVTEGIYQRFAEAMLERTRKLKVGDAVAPNTQIGPVVDQRQLDKNLRYVAIGTEEGGQLLCGGERLAGDGFFFSPAIIENHNPQARLNQEEVFGPVSTLIRVKDFDEAIAVANATPYGLSGGICTSSLKYATQFRKDMQAGMVMVNAPTAGVDYHVPFGGSKASSFGPREQGNMAVEFYTKVKTHYIA